MANILPGVLYSSDMRILTHLFTAVLICFVIWLMAILILLAIKVAGEVVFSTVVLLATIGLFFALIGFVKGVMR